MIGIKRAICLSNLDIKLHEGIINSVKVELIAKKKTSKVKLEKLVIEKQNLSNLIIEALLLKDQDE